MSEQPTSPKLSTSEQILDLLLDALLERQSARRLEGETPPVPLAPTPTLSVDWLVGPAGEAVTPSVSPAPTPTAERPTAGIERPSPRASVSPAPPTRPLREPGPGEEGWTPPPLSPSVNLGRAVGRLLLVLAVLVVLVNVPLNRQGTSLARMMPPSASLVLRDGLVLKGSGPEIYVLEDNKLRWISSLEAFEFFHYRWEQVHVVEDNFLEQFEKGRPIHVLLKCQGSPHIYALENGQKRWIEDIPTLEAEGYVWEDVKFVSCSYLRNLPDGVPLPADAGPPPQP